MLLNKYNFLRWYDAAPTTGLPEVPYAYWRDRESCGYMPIGLPTESLAFYMNIPNGLLESTYNYFADLRIALIRASDGAVINNNVGPLQKHYTDNPTNLRFNIYATLVIPTAGTGIHYFRIFRNTGGTEVFRSSYILIRNDQTELYNTTSFVRFNHDRFFYNIKYHELSGFYQQFRLGISVIDEQNEGDKEVYKEVTTGKPRTFQNYMDKIVKVETYHFDRDAHDAAGIMFDHSFIEINGRRYYPKGTYKRVPDSKSKQHKGEMELYDDEFASVNRCG